MTGLPCGSELALVLALALAPACKGDDPGSDTATTGPTTEGSSAGATETATTGDSTASSGATATSTTTTTSTTSTGSATESTGFGPCEPAALGAPCVDPTCDCASNACYVVGPLGGVCSECDEDADCAATTGFGCNAGNPLAGVPAVCSKTGAIGQGCETADACADGLTCPTVIDVPGILSASACSECAADSDCQPEQECAPVYDIANIAGYYHCVDPGSVSDNEGCDITGDGSECASGTCAPAQLMGIPVIAVCSPCVEDAQCMPGMTCQLPEVALDVDSFSLIPGACI